MENNDYKDYTAVLRIASGQERETDFVLIEHAYSKPFNWNPGLSSGRPRKTLFISRITKDPVNPNEHEEEIDIVTVSQASALVPYDIEKAKHVMNECERHVRGISQLDEENMVEDDETENEIWEENVDRTNWTETQHEVFGNVVKILDSHHLARLALSGTPNEPVRRRAVVDKASAKFRRLFAKINWNNKLTQWLHGCLLQHLTPSYLAAYIDVLQTLKSKIPTLVDKMIALAALPKTPRVEALNLLLKRPWDPALPSLNQSKPKKLEKMPIIIIVPNGATSPNLPQASRRTRFFNTQLQHLAKSIPVNVSTTPELSDATSILDGILHEVKVKIVECRRQFAGQPIVLLGWGVGAILAAMISLKVKVDAMALLGFPMQSHAGKRGEADDILLDVTTPSLFIIGSKALNTSIDDVEDFRHRLKTITSLVVISDAEATLKISNKKQYWEGLTQSMVDRCIVDEIGDFFSSVLCDEVQHPLPAAKPAIATAVEPAPIPMPKSKSVRDLVKKRKASPLSHDNAFTVPSKVFRAGTNLSQQLGLKIPLGNSGSSVQQTSEVVVGSTGKAPTNEDQHDNDPSSSWKKGEGSAKFSGSLISNSNSRTSDNVAKTSSASSVTTISIGGLASVSKQRYQTLFQATEEAYEDTDGGRIEFGRPPQTADPPVTSNKRGRPPSKLKGIGRAANLESKVVKHYGRGRPPSVSRSALTAAETTKVNMTAADDTSMAVLTFTGGATDGEAQDKIGGLSTVGRGFLTLGKGGGTSSVRVFSTNSKIPSHSTNTVGEVSPVIKISSAATTYPTLSSKSLSKSTEAEKSVPESIKVSTIGSVVCIDKGADAATTSPKVQPSNQSGSSSLPQISAGQLPITLQGITAGRMLPLSRTVVAKPTSTIKSTVMLVTSCTSTTSSVPSSMATKATIKPVVITNKYTKEISLNPAKTDSISVTPVEPSTSTLESYLNTSQNFSNEKSFEVKSPSQGTSFQLSQLKPGVIVTTADSSSTVSSKYFSNSTKSEVTPIVVSSKPGSAFPSLTSSSNKKITYAKLVAKKESLKVAGHSSPPAIKLSTKSSTSDRIIFTPPLKQNEKEAAPTVSGVSSVNPVISDVKVIHQPITQSGIVTKKVVISKKVCKELSEGLVEKSTSPSKSGSTDDDPMLDRFSNLSPAEELNLVLGQTADALSTSMEFVESDGRKANVRTTSKSTVPANSSAKRRLSEIKVSITTPIKRRTSTDINKSSDHVTSIEPVAQSDTEALNAEKVTPKSHKQMGKEDIGRVTRSTAKMVGSTRRGRQFRSSM